MPIIKVNKKMNLPQLVKWAWKNNIENRTYRTTDGLSVDIGLDGKVIVGYVFNKDDLFTVEVEEQVDEFTMIPKILILNKDDTTVFSKDRTINSLCKSIIKTIYVVNDDLTMTLIWKNGKLVN